MTSTESEPFDRLAGLPQHERHAYNLVVEGRGHLLDEQATRNGAAAPGREHAPASTIRQRYLDGDALLRRLELSDVAHLDVPAKPSVVVLPSSTARTLTFVFSGNNPEFALPAHLLIAHDTHLVLIHDRRRCFGLAGVPGLGGDYAATLAALLRIVDALRPDHVAVLGISAGGAGAIKFACDLQAHTLLGLSVPTTLDLADEPGAALSHYPQLTKLYRHDRSLGIDLAAYYATSPVRPDTTLVYGSHHLRDAWLANRMAGLPGVTLRGIPDFTGHTTYRHLYVTGGLGEYLDRLYPPASPTGGVSPKAGAASGVLQTAG